MVVFLLAYRPGTWYPDDIEYLAVPLLLFMVNGLVHFRLLTNRPITWRWLLLLCATDVSLITAQIMIHIGFDSFIFVAYYPSLALFAVVFTSFWLGLAWTTLTAVAYALVCFTVDSGFDLGAGHEKVLVARLAAMYALVLGLSLIIRFERIRWQTAVSRERQPSQKGEREGRRRHASCPQSRLSSLITREHRLNDFLCGNVNYCARLNLQNDSNQ